MTKKDLPVATRPSLVAKFADKYSIEPDKLMTILKATAFKQRDDTVVSNEQMAALLVVADQYGLNPFTKEIYAFPDKQNGIVPVVSVDGWSRIINENPALDGIEFKYSDETVQHKGHTCHDWMECTIYRKDRAHPTVVREYFNEVVREMNFKTAWDTHPNRLHRHKSLIQCARIAFGFVGIYDVDEAQRIIERDVTPAAERQRPAALADKQVLTEKLAESEKEVLETAGSVTITPAHEKILRAAMEPLAISEAELCKKFGIPNIADMPHIFLNEAMEWVKNPS